MLPDIRSSEQRTRCFVWRQCLNNTAQNACDHRAEAPHICGCCCRQAASPHCLSCSPRPSLRPRRGVYPSYQLQETYARHFSKPKPIDLLTHHSAGRRLPLHPQCLSLRWRRISPGTPPSATLFAPAEPILQPSRDEFAVHRPGPSECECTVPDRRERAECGDAAILILAERA